MNAYVSLSCEWCSQTFERRASDAFNPWKNGRKRFCSRQCVLQWQRGGESLTRQCQNCGTKFERAKRSHDQRRFCTRSCAASFNNRLRPRRRTSSCCDDCGEPKSRSSRQCHRCLRERFMSRTIGSLREEYSTAAFHAKIRGLARTAYKGPMVCAACGYGLHVDICHIRGVSDWPPEATLSEVNHISNLVALDKRCHWEFDHGYLTYQDGTFVPIVR